MYEAVTVPRLTMVTSTVSKESLAKDTHTDRHTRTHTHTHTPVVDAKIVKSLTTLQTTNDNADGSNKATTSTRAR